MGTSYEYGDEYKYSQHKVDVIDLKENRFETVPLDSLDKRDFHADPLLFMEPDMAAAARYRELGISGVPVPDIVNFNRLLRRIGFADDIALIMETLEKTWQTIVSGIDETRKLQEEARTKRIEDSKRLEKLKEEYKAKMNS